MFSQARSREQVLHGVQTHGLAPGGAAMITLEDSAASTAIETGIYATWRSGQSECTRVGPGAKCFCGHLFEDHAFLSRKAAYPRCSACTCSHFEFIPQRPEEVGDWWLPRRKGFNVHTWRAKCRCGHGHDEHDPTSRRCRCGCGMFQSNFACVVCDRKWEDHETVFETAQERLAQGRTIGEDFRPLANDKQLQQLVFPGRLGDGSSPSRGAPAPGELGPSRPGPSSTASRVRPPQVGPQFAEKSIRIMHASSGGAVKGQPTANRWGKVEEGGSPARASTVGGVAGKRLLQQQPKT